MEEERKWEKGRQDKRKQEKKRTRKGKGKNKKVLEMKRRKSLQYIKLTEISLT